MKLYIGDFDHYYQQDQDTDLPTAQISEQVKLWEEALQEQSHALFSNALSWNAYEGLLYEIEDDDFYHLCACALHIEAKKPITRIYSNQQPDKLYEKWERGLQPSKLSALLEADCFFPVLDSFLFAYVDPQGEASIFATLDDLKDCLIPVLHSKETSEALQKAKKTAKQLIDIIEEAMYHKTLLIQVN